MRSGDRLLVSAEVLGNVRITADQRIAKDASDTPLYAGLALRAAAVTAPSLAPAITGPEPTTRPATGPARGVPTAPRYRRRFRFTWRRDIQTW